MIQYDRAEPTVNEVEGDETNDCENDSLSNTDGKGTGEHMPDTSNHDMTSITSALGPKTISAAMTSLCLAENLG